MTKAQIAIDNAGYNELFARRNKRAPQGPAHYWVCTRCNTFQKTLTTLHAARCGFSSLKEMKNHPDVIERGGRRH